MTEGRNLPSLQQVIADDRTDKAMEPLERGWALKQRRKCPTFDEDQRKFLIEKYNEGETTKQKLDGNSVATLMRNAQVGDKKRFQLPQYLTGQQIASYFSRVTADRRRQQPTDEVK